MIPLTRTWRTAARKALPMVLAVLALTIISLLSGGAMNVTRAAAGGPDPRVLVPDATHNRPVHIGGYTVYTNSEGETATGAAPIDAVRGYTPPAIGFARGPDVTPPVCLQPPDPAVSDRTKMSDTELAAYGLPTHGQIPDFATWKQVAMSIHGHVCTIRTLYFNGHPLMNSPARSSHATIASPTTRRAAVGSNRVDVPNSFSDGGWSGWAADRYHCKVSTCPKLTATEGYWNIPTAFYDGRANDSMTAWYGVGGYEGTDPNMCDGVGPGLV